MSKPRLFFFSLFFFLSPHGLAFGNSNSPGYVITKDNHDPFVNLRERERETLHSKILTKIPNNTVMSCSVDNTANPDFCYVKFNENNPINDGYIRKSRLLFQDRDSSFSKVFLVKSDLYNALYKNNQVSVKIKLAFVKLKQKDFSWYAKDKTTTLMYQDKKAYGTDNEIIRSTFVYSDIDIKKNGKNYSVPPAKFKGLFIPSYFVHNNLIFDGVSIYYNAAKDLLYIFSTQADGAGIYTVAFTLKHNKLIGRDV